MREAHGLTTRTAQQLLPFAFEARAAEQPQRIHFWEGYESAVRSGAKRQTIRIDDPFHPGSVDLVFEQENGVVVSIGALVTDARSVPRSELTEADSTREGFERMRDLEAALTGIIRA